MQKTIRRRAVETALESEDLHPLLSRLYASRKIKSKTELERDLQALLPFDGLFQIDQAANLIADAILNQENILVVGDFDADGATSSALCVRALKQMGAKRVDFLVPNRFAFGYGLTPELVAAAIDLHLQPQLIITVDNGIANHAGVLAANQKGIKVIITDHHLPGETLPFALAIVNPNQPKDSFQSKFLAGVGVIFYVMLALRKTLRERNWFLEKNIPCPNMAQFLDLVALGTVADLVPLDQNNRILVYQGLRRIRAGLCIPAIPALLELSGRDCRRITAADLGFAVASRLNAAGRLDDMSLGITCLLSDSPIEARDVARRLDQLNDERRNIEKDMQVQAFSILQKISENLAGDLPKGICLYDESWHQGVIGILAARIKEKYNRPVIVFANGTEGELKGSARSILGLHIRDLLAAIHTKYPDLILKFGGHAMAAGLSIAKNQFEFFEKIYNDTVSAKISEDELRHCVWTDGELEDHHFSYDVAEMLREAGPWGQAFPEPLFDDVFRVLDQRIVGDRHLKLRLEKGNKILDAIYFFVDTQLWPNHRARQLRAVYRLDINEFKGRQNVQLLIEHLEVIE